MIKAFFNKFTDMGIVILFMLTPLVVIGAALVGGLHGAGFAMILCGVSHLIMCPFYLKESM
jgi:hypothetical protein